MDAWRQDLHPSRGHAQQCPLYALWILPPLSIALSLATDRCTPLSACVAALIVVAAILCRKQALARHWVPLISAVCLATTASLFVDLGRGTMLAAHAEIIYMLAMLLTVPFFDWRAIAVAAATCGLEWTGLDLFAASQSTAASIETMAASWLLLAVSASAMIWLAITGQSLASRAGLAFASSAKEAAELEASLRAMSEMASDLAGLATEERLARQFDQDVGASVTAALTAAEGVRIAVETVSAFAMHSARQTAFITDTSVETSVSASNLANSVEQMAVAVARATSEVRDVSTAAFKAMEDAGATNVTVQNLADSAEKIGEIVQMINDIAEQTNLLALNATIEAARAGEAGKGFSVVATEVKALARRTSRATQDIEKQISLIRVEMRTAMGAIDNIANTVAELGGITVSVAGTMEEQASRAQDIASHALSAATSVSEVAENLSDLANGAMRAETAAAHASSEADQLVNQCGNVKLTIEHFVQALVAA